MAVRSGAIHQLPSGILVFAALRNVLNFGAGAVTDTRVRIVRDLFYLGISVGFPGTPKTWDPLIRQAGPIQASHIGGPMSLGVPGASPSGISFTRCVVFFLIGKGPGPTIKKCQQNPTMGADSRFTEYVFSDQFYLLGW